MADKDYVDLLRQRLIPQRFWHSVNVADSAKELALRFGYDPEGAYLAGLLHDVTKNAPKEEHLELFALGNMTLTPVEQGNQKLWHAMSGAVYVEKKLGFENPDFIRAVRYHTTARAGMSLLEKIIYIADYISEERDYEDVDVMRYLAKRSLEEAMLYALQYQMRSLSKELRTLHPDSVDCYNELLMQGVSLPEIPGNTEESE